MYSNYSPDNEKHVKQVSFFSSLNILAVVLLMNANILYVCIKKIVRIGGWGGGASP